MSRPHSRIDEDISGVALDLDVGRPWIEGLPQMARQPDQFSPAMIQQIIANVVMTGASDVTIQTNRQPRIEVHGRLYRVGARPFNRAEVNGFLDWIYAPNAAAMIAGRNVLDFAWELRFDRSWRQRFRVNATGILAGNEDGVEITLRVLPRVTPSIASVSLDPALVEPMLPNEGIVIVAGATGHGKSTTLAALTRHLLEDHKTPRKIVDLQNPIEYTFYDVIFGNSDGSPSLMGQSEVGRHLVSFGQGVWTALRRKPHVIIVGEARDLETIEAAIVASLTGHLVHTTTHAGSVSETLRRLTQTFPAQEREGRAFDLISSLRCVVAQYLLPTADRKGRTPIREYLRFDANVRNALAERHPDEWPKMLAAFMRSDDPAVFKEPMWLAAQKAMDKGLIDETTARPFLVRRGRDD